jgi:hypothetical protein
LWLDFSEAGAREAHRPRHAASRVWPRNADQGRLRQASRQMAPIQAQCLAGLAAVANAADERLIQSSPGRLDAVTAPLVLPWLGV